MSAEATGWVFRHSPAVGATLMVHLAIADSVNDQNGYEFWMRLRNLAEKARLSEGATRKAIAALVKSGLLEIIDDGRSREDAGSATRPRRFRFLMPDGTPTAYDPPRPQREGPPPPRALGAGARAEDAGTRAQGAGDLQPKVEPKVEPKNPPSPPAGQLALVQPPPAAPAVPRGTPSAGPLLDFDAFWAVYPKRAGKAAARRAWQKATKLANPADIIAGAVRYRDDPNRDPAYTKMAQGWLNDGRWEDDPLPDRQSRPTGGAAGTMAALERFTRTVTNEPQLPPADPGWLTMPAIGGAT